MEMIEQQALKNIIQDMEKTLIKNLGLREFPGVALTFTMPPEYKDVHWTTNLDEKGAALLFQATAEKMKRNEPETVPAVLNLKLTFYGLELTDSADFGRFEYMVQAAVQSLVNDRKIFEAFRLDPKKAGSVAVVGSISDPGGLSDRDMDRTRPAAGGGVRKGVRKGKPDTKKGVPD
jgi:hypothetical protein